MKRYISMLILLLLSTQATAWEINFPAPVGKGELRITIKARDGGDWAVCRAYIIGGAGKPFAKLVGRKGTSGSYRLTDKQTKDVKTGDYRFMAGGTVFGNGKITAKLKCS